MTSTTELLEHKYLEDMEAIARLKKIVLNIRLMDQIVEERSINGK